MDRSRYRWMLRLGIVLVAGLIALLWAVSKRGQTLTIENHSQQTIDSLQITIGDETYNFKNVAEAAEVTATSVGHGEESFSVDGRLADGSRIHAGGRLKGSVQFLLLPGGQLQEKPKPKGLF